MASSYGSLCDAFYLDMYLNTELDLPSERDTVLTFFERIRRQFHSMGNFYRRDSGDFCLEEYRHGEKYRWVAMEIDRICSCCAEPEDVEDAAELHQLVLEIAPYMLGVSSLDVSSLDVTFTMDFDFQGNHNEVIADAFFGSTAFGSLLELPNARSLGFSPSAVVSVSKDCRTQVRISVEPRTNVYDIRNEKYKSDNPISLYFTVRQYPFSGTRFDMVSSFGRQLKIAEELMAENIIPNFVKPLSNAIAQRG